MARQRRIVDGFFDPTNPAVDVHTALTALRSAEGLNRSWGCVSRPLLIRYSSGVARPYRGGLHCEHIFGSFDPWRCACGKTVGRQGVSCDKCGVECVTTEERSRRWAHLEVPTGVRYPGTDLIVKTVPVLPPGERPSVPIDAPTALHPQPSLLDRAYQALINRAGRLSRLVELGAPEIIIRNEERMLQQAFEGLLHAVRAGHGTVGRPHAWGEDKEPRPLRLRCPAEPPEATGCVGHAEVEAPVALLWVDDERLLVQARGQLLLVRDGAVLQQALLAWLRPVSIQNGCVMLLSAEPGGSYMQGEPEYVLDGVGMLDLETWHLLDRVPSDARVALFTKDQPEDACLVDWRTGREAWLEIDSDRPGALCYSRGHRFVWVGGEHGDRGRILDTETALTHVRVGALDLGWERTLRCDGSFGGREDWAAARQRDEDFWGAAAIGPGVAGDWRILTGDGVVYANGRALFALERPVRAAAFGPGAGRVALLVDDELLVISVESEPRILERRSLDAMLG